MQPVSSARPPIHVTVVTGFLGAGKSTLVQRWLQELPRGETAVIVNERGDVGIDGELLAAHVARLTEITGGCVCCNSQAELISALEQLSQQSPAPSRILIETSGAASPAGIIRATTVREVPDHVRLDGVVTVVDVTRLARTLTFDLAVEQLGFADVVVMSQVDRAPNAGVDVDAVEQQLLQYAPAAVMTRAERGSTSESLLELLSKRPEALHVAPEHTHHSAIEAVSLVHEGELDEEQFGDWVESALGQVQARLLRVKGILAMQGVEARVIVQGVGEAVEVELGRPWGNAPRSSRLVVLGLGLDAEALETGFRQCAARAFHG